MKLRALLLACLAFATPALAQTREVVVATYNVQNYVGEVRDGPRSLRSKAKPPEAVAALVRIIAEINPDILGLCEMGDPDQFADFQVKLREAGLGYTASAYVEGADTVRHLALLSRFPIASHDSRSDVRYLLNGVEERVQRGFLDVTVQVNPDYQLRLVGAHLKSKLAAPEGESLMRRHEAQLLRKHIERILAADPQVNLLLFGDFNDQRNEPAIQEIMGTRGTAAHLVDLPAQDAVGDRWTHYWKVADVYSRLDYLFASPALIREVSKEKTLIYRGPDWLTASDHRPVYTSIQPVNLAPR
ncbi:MAG: endonuclease/exonuclease/phosphatase family protein [Chthoniobacteraceae bacterium]